MEQLIKYLPTPDHMKKLEALRPEYDSLAEPEQFAIVVSSIELSSYIHKSQFILFSQSIKIRDAQSSLGGTSTDASAVIDACRLQRGAMITSTGPSIP